MLSSLPLLSLLIWTPVLGGVLVLMTSGDNQVERGRFIALFTTIICLILSIPLCTDFNFHTAAMQFRETMAWIPSYKIKYDIGVDGISIPLIILTNFMTLIVVLSAWRSVQDKVAQYLAAFLIMQGMLVGVFAAIDSLLFFVFWEATLIPMYLIIGIWGSENRFYAAVKFFIYTFFGSVLMLVAFLYLHSKAHSFSILDFYALKISMPAQILIFLAFFLGFAVKVPMWPVHTWLPDAHTEAPAGGSVILAAVLLKLGAYGFLRFSLPITPDASGALTWLMVTLSLIAIVYIGFVALAQTDMKRLIAYSSIAHMGLVTLGSFIIFTIFKHTGSTQGAALGIDGAIAQVISHGFVSGALFLSVGYLYDRLHTRMIGDFGGVANKMPMFAMFFMLFALANAGLPGTSGFVGEFLVVLGAFKANFWVAAIAATTLVLAPAYTLWMYKRAIFGEVANEAVGSLEDIKGLELLTFILLGLAILWLGVYPDALLNMLHSSVDNLIVLSNTTKI